MTTYIIETDTNRFGPFDGVDAAQGAISRLPVGEWISARVCSVRPVEEMGPLPILALAHLPRGRDCTEAESAAIKAYLRTVRHDVGTVDEEGILLHPTPTALALRWPVEWAEIWAEEGQ